MHFNPKSRIISFAHNWFLGCRSVLKIYTEHGNITVVLRANFQNDWTNKMDIPDGRDFARFESNFPRAQCMTNDTTDDGEKFTAYNEYYLFGVNSLSSTFLLGHIDGLVQDCSNSIADALELQQSCIKPSILVGIAWIIAWHQTRTKPLPLWWSCGVARVRYL